MFGVTLHPCYRIMNMEWIHGIWLCGFGGNEYVYFSRLNYIFYVYNNGTDCDDLWDMGLLLVYFFWIIIESLCRWQSNEWFSIRERQYNKGLLICIIYPRIELTTRAFDSSLCFARHGLQFCTVFVFIPPLPTNLQSLPVLQLSVPYPLCARPLWQMVSASVLPLKLE